MPPTDPNQQPTPSPFPTDPGQVPQQPVQNPVQLDAQPQPTSQPFAPTVSPNPSVQPEAQPGPLAGPLPQPGVQSPEPQAIVPGVAINPVQSATPQPNNFGQPGQPGQPVTSGPIMNPQNLAAGQMGNQKKSSKFTKVFIPVLVAVIVLVVGGVAALGMLGGSGIKKSDLIEDKQGNLSYKRPGSFTKSSEASTDYDVIWTKDGKKLEDSNIAVAVAAQEFPFGINYDDLTAEQKSEFKAELDSESFKQSLQSSGGSGECDEVKNVTVNEKPNSNYSEFIMIDALCVRKNTTEIPEVRMRAGLGIKGTDMHMLIIILDDKLVGQSNSAIDEMLNTFKPN